MRKRIFVSVGAVAISVVTLLSVLVMPVMAGGQVTYADDAKCFYGINGENGYEILIDDEAHLLTENEEYELYEDMMEASAYGNVVFKTTDDTQGTTGLQYMDRYMDYTYGLDTNGTVFLIDMDNRKLWIIGYGGCKSTVNDKTGTVITDNVYKYASDEEYYECAANAFKQIGRTLHNENVFGPMRYIGNGCIAVICAIVFSFVFAFFKSSASKAGDRELISNIENSLSVKNTSVQFIRQERIYDPPSDSSSGGGGSSGGSSGGSGGSHGF